jgi:hypothetical protein
MLLNQSASMEPDAAKQIIWKMLEFRILVDIPKP